MLGPTLASVPDNNTEGDATKKTEAVTSTPDDTRDDALLHRHAISHAALQQQLQLQLQRFPGGVQTAEDEITYHDGAFIMTFARPEQALLARLTRGPPRRSRLARSGGSAGSGTPRGRRLRNWSRSVSAFTGRARKG